MKNTPTIKDALIEAIKANINLRVPELRVHGLNHNILSRTITDKRYIQSGGIGSEKRITTYCFEDDIIWCGCFTVTLEQFENTVLITHKDNEIYLKEYLTFIQYLKSLM